MQFTNRGILFSDDNDNDNNDHDNILNQFNSNPNYHHHDYYRFSYHSVCKTYRLPCNELNKKVGNKQLSSKERILLLVFSIICLSISFYAIH